MKFGSKEDLLSQIREEHARFLALAHEIPMTEYGVPGVWGDDWTVKDLFAHLTEWEQMFLHWFAHGMVDEEPSLPAEGYRWNQTPALNRAIWQKYAATPWPEVKAAFDQSYEEILDLAERLMEPELLEAGHFAWTGKLPLASYFGPNTCSHYRTASKFLERWLRQRDARAPAIRGD